MYCIMTSMPNLRKLDPENFVWRSTKEAQDVKSQISQRTDKPLAVSKDVVHQSALQEAKHQGIRDPDLFTLRGMYKIQFGQYRGQSFRWLAENDLGYTTNLLYQVDKEGGNTGVNPLNDNKRELKWYLESFPDGRAAMQQRKRERQPKKEQAADDVRKRKAASLVASNLPPALVAKKVRSPVKRMAPNIPSTSVPKPIEEEMADYDEEFLSQIQEMESSQPAVKKTTPIQPSASENVQTSQSTGSKTLASLRTAQSVVASLSQPDPYPLPTGWKKTLPIEDQKWISKALCSYDKSGNVVFHPRQLWEYPPQPHLLPAQSPNPDRYFAHRLLVWYPRKLMKVCLCCPNNGDHILSSGGNYSTARQVLDMDSYYNLVSEYLYCHPCKKRFVAWSWAIVRQLDDGHRRLFPCLLTYKYACDIKVVTLLATRSLGNSATQLQRKLEEQHSRGWLSRAEHYLSDCKAFSSTTLVLARQFPEPPPAIQTPKYKWLQTVYCIDVLQRIDAVKAALTSTFGQILKIDSTKKIVRKLAGHIHGTASWCSNIGNEYGQVLNSVLTCEEGRGLEEMVSGIVGRYSSAGISPPEVLYVDRDCCDQSFTHSLFKAWPNLVIRLDIWHFMRRFTGAVSTESHQLYGVFMSRLSKCIFEWSADDVQLLREAKRSEMVLKQVPDTSDDDIVRWLSKKEFALHCRRRTRGTQETNRLIGELLEAFMGDQGRDTLGIPLFDVEKLTNIWETQKRHVACIQDPDGVSLYTQTGTLKKGSIQLPKYRCARGSTSLESFHNHLAKFIPGTSASDTHFQAYLLEGLKRWNEDRERQMSSKPLKSSSYCDQLRHAVNELSRDVLKKEIVADYQPPRKYTGEKIGLEYLFAQTGKVLQDVISDPDQDTLSNFESEAEQDDERELEDEGFGDEDEVTADDTRTLEVPDSSVKAHAQNFQGTSGSVTISQPSVAEHNEPGSLPTSPEEEQTTSTEDASGPDNIRGWTQVDRLSEYLYRLRDQSAPLSNKQADFIIQLWGNLLEYDKTPTVPKPRLHTRISRASETSHKMSRSKRSTVLGVDHIERGFHGTEGGPAQRPDSNRIMECLVIKLCSAFPSPVKQSGKRINRWSQIMRAYGNIRQKVTDHGYVLKETNLCLFNINTETLRSWYYKRTVDHTTQMLLQNVRLGTPAMMASSQLPNPMFRPPVYETLPVAPDEQHQFELPQITVGMAKFTKRTLPSATPRNPDSELDQGQMTPLPIPRLP